MRKFPVFNISAMYHVILLWSPRIMW